MDSYKRYKYWLESDYFDDETKNELKKIAGNPKEIEERFYKDLEFGTGGLRGIIGAGTNRMNKYTVRKASQGLAGYISKKGDEFKQRGIVIAYDSRKMSEEFALESALVFAGNGIKAYLFDELKPTPELSFAVRLLKASAGIVITASHNPKEYNGYKVYGEDGAQMSLEGTNAVLREINAITDISNVNFTSREEAFDKGLLDIIGKRVDDEYIKLLKNLSVNKGVVDKVSSSFKVVYTPLHGTGNKLVGRILRETGLKHLLIVKEQQNPDPDFKTVKSPNPEDRDALTLAIELAKRENADLVIATDPDCDRMGLAVRNANGEYSILTGNQTGCLLMEYILSHKKKMNELPPQAFVVKTIVTTELARAIADNYNVEMIEVLTGFKFIGEKIRNLDEYGNKKFIFGFEESFGYLAGTYSRDKDGVVSSMLATEMAAYYKSRGMNLYDGLIELFNKYGFFMEDIFSITLEGREGQEKIAHVMNKLREEKPAWFNSSEVSAIRDYLENERTCLVTGAREPLSLPESNVLYFEMKDGSWFCIRPSGTEPKIKVYLGVSGTGIKLAQNKLNTLKGNVEQVVDKLMAKS